MKYLKLFEKDADYYKWSDKSQIVAKFPSCNELYTDYEAYIVGGQF